MFFSDNSIRTVDGLKLKIASVEQPHVTQTLRANFPSKVEGSVQPDGTNKIAEYPQYQKQTIMEMLDRIAQYHANQKTIQFEAAATKAKAEAAKKVELEKQPLEPSSVIISKSPTPPPAEIVEPPAPTSSTSALSADSTAAAALPLKKEKEKVAEPASTSKETQAVPATNEQPKDTITSTVVTSDLSTSILPPPLVVTTSVPESATPVSAETSSPLTVAALPNEIGSDVDTESDDSDDDENLDLTTAPIPVPLSESANTAASNAVAFVIAPPPAPPLPPPAASTLPKVMSSPITGTGDEKRSILLESIIKFDRRASLKSFNPEEVAAAKKAAAKKSDLAGALEEGLAKHHKANNDSDSDTDEHDIWEDETSSSSPTHSPK